MAVSSPAITASAARTPSPVRMSKQASKSALSVSTSRTCRTQPSRKARNCGTDVAELAPKVLPSSLAPPQSAPRRGDLRSSDNTASRSSAWGFTAAFPIRHSAQQLCSMARSTAASVHPTATMDAKHSQKPGASSGAAPAPGMPASSAPMRAGNASGPDCRVAAWRWYHRTSCSVTTPVPPPGSTKYREMSSHTACAVPISLAARPLPSASAALARCRSTALTLPANCCAAAIDAAAAPLGLPRADALARRPRNASNAGSVSSATRCCAPAMNDHCTTYAAPLESTPLPPFGWSRSRAAAPCTRHTRSSFPTPHWT
mmetsp:Transcript_27246/g.68225  ORF Transcript_27246/g.68225 Transcript_27246/m.68225 type:complete len:316 (-) Transcript_27246:98-1045(-)